MPDPTAPTSEILNRAADLIEKRGWTRGSWRDAGPFCLEGGVMAAMGENFSTIDLEGFWACPTYRAVQAYLSLPQTRNAAGTPASPLFRWNDDQPLDGAAHVIEVLRACAVIEESRERQAVEVSA